MAQRIVFLLRRNPQLTREAFQDYWLTTHAPLVVSMAASLGIVRYQQVHAVQATRHTKCAEFDGLAELWVDYSRRSTDKQLLVSSSRALFIDEQNFIDHANSPIWIADEDHLLSGPKDGLRVTAALRRKEGTSRQQFLDHWHDVHGPWALRHPEVWGFTSYTQLRSPDNADENPMVRERNAPPAFDGLSEIYRVPATASRAVVDHMRAEILADELNFIDTDESPVFTGYVHVIL